jgi:BlaI family transcriptional regulator, penicillinase repressor
MPNPPAISDAEWDVMQVAWAAAPQPVTASQVVEKLAGRKGWNPKTVRTLLNRLMNKGALAVEAQGKRYLYRPAVTREECVRQESRSFISRVFDGSVAPALLHFLQGARLSQDDIQKLRETLRREEESAARDSIKPK